jgi:hypothetical protein
MVMSESNAALSRVDSLETMREDAPLSFLVGEFYFKVGDKYQSENEE